MCWYVNQSLLIAEIYQHSITSTTLTWLRPQKTKWKPIVNVKCILISYQSNLYTHTAIRTCPWREQSFVREFCQDICVEFIQLLLLHSWQVLQILAFPVLWNKSGKVSMNNEAWCHTLSIETAVRVLTAQRPLQGKSGMSTDTTSGFSATAEIRAALSASVASNVLWIRNELRSQLSLVCMTSIYDVKNLQFYFQGIL